MIVCLKLTYFLLKSVSILNTPVFYTSNFYPHFLYNLILNSHILSTIIIFSFFVESFIFVSKFENSMSRTNFELWAWGPDLRWAQQNGGVHYRRQNLMEKRMNYPIYCTFNEDSGFCRTQGKGRLHDCRELLRSGGWAGSLPESAHRTELTDKLHIITDHH